MFSFQSALQAEPTGFPWLVLATSVFRKRKCASPSKMTSSWKPNPSQGLPTGPGSPHSPPTGHRGSWEGLRWDHIWQDHPAQSVVTRLWPQGTAHGAQTRRPQQEAYKETAWPGARRGTAGEGLQEKNQEREIELDVRYTFSKGT